MRFIPFRLHGTDTPVDPVEARLITSALERSLDEAPWAEHCRVHVSRAGLLGVVLCRARQEAQARDGLLALLTAATQSAAEPDGWQPEL